MPRRMPIAISLCFVATPLLASGSGIVRDLSSTSFRDCPKDARLKEHYYVAADAYSYDEEIVIACLRDSTSAIWVFKAAEGCAHPTCRDQLASPTEHIGNRNDPDSSPAEMTYASVGYEEGEDCVLDEALPVWSCKTYRRHPDTPFEVTTTGATRDIFDTDKDAPTLPLGIRRSRTPRSAH